MSEQVNIEQVREVANKPTVPLEQVWRDMLNQMADEIERLRSENAELIDSVGHYESMMGDVSR